MDSVIWCNMWNTTFQGCLAGWMWRMNRFNRPSSTTGLFVALACVVAGMAECMIFCEKRKIAKYERKVVPQERETGSSGFAPETENPF
ncbi:uncharacterized protein BDW43DRAFT_266916 [Aspergillus alliaceus]|uniref:uncharacterized protein n=1 Tax=Petromyces alliaceus TaxID=209559 RepID=UPI0012A7568D|nr:uncharacterized protein BDW43DRAFT_266916 [Aspergillus alliaceus]KAB8236431.1 hypothetical protein BDW43DRAFT_266916 [Aspergillus alliaceus]